MRDDKLWPIDTDDDVERLARHCGWGDNRRYMTPTDYAIWCERMRKFAALAALQREQWVPVSERLPPEGVDVLVLHDYGQIVGNPAHRDCGKRYGYQITRRYGNGFLSDLLETGQVTHWMPLPPAPQTEEPRGINVSGHTYVRRSATSYVCRRCGHDMCREEPKPCSNQQPEEAL